MDLSLQTQFAEVEWTHWWFLGRRAVLRDAIARRLEGRSSLEILDVGCGTGAMLGVLGEYGQVTAMDASEEALELCRDVFPDITFTVGTVPEGLQYGSSFDLVTALDVIEHLEDDVASLAAIREIVVPDGVLVCSVPAYQWMWGPHDVLSHHKRRYTRARLRAALEAGGWVVERITYFNSFLFPLAAGARVFRRHVLRRESPRSDFVVPRAIVNAGLTHMFGAERFVLRHLAFPFGVSLMAIAHRPSRDPSERDRFSEATTR